MLAADDGIAGILSSGFTLKSESLHETLKRASTKRAAAVARRIIGNKARLICLAGDLNWLGRGSHARTDVMKLRRVHHIQAVIANGLETGKNLISRRLHNAFAAF